MAIRKKTNFLNYVNSNKLIQNLGTKIFRHVTVLYVELWVHILVARLLLLNAFNIFVQINITNCDVLNKYNFTLFNSVV
jgi:hypothetical protein